MVKVGIIGMGGISAAHINGLKNVKDAKITAICDIDGEKLNAAGDRLGIPEEYRFKDYKGLIACPRGAGG